MKNNIALVGLGAISKYYIKAIRKNQNICLSAICDIDRKRLEDGAHLGAGLYSNIDKLLAARDFESVVITTPNHTHFNLVMKCLKKNKHVLCEKPLALDSTQAKKLMKEASGRGLVLKTAFHRRYNKNISDLIAKKNKLSINAMHVRYLEDISRHSCQEKWYKLIKKSGGGCVIDNGVNVFDFLWHLVGDLDVKKVSLGYKGKSKFSPESNAYILLTFNRGRGTGTVELDWDYGGEVKDISIYLSNGRIIRRNLLAGFDEFKGSLWHEYDSVINDFINDLKSPDRFRDGGSLAVLKLVDKIYKARFSNKKPILAG